MTTDTKAVADAAEVLTRCVGLRLDPGARGRLSRCVIAASNERGEPIAEYVAHLEGEPSALQDLVDQVTVQETAFFRDPAQFEALASVVLPSLPAPTVIWSAACSNGQEAYSVAMLLAESGHAGSRVVATDISTRAIERSREARYTATEIKGMSSARRSRYLNEVGDRFEIVPEIRGRVEVSRNNLAVDAPPFAPGACSVVFLRNVLIYFGRDDVVRLLQRIAEWMLPGGWLFLGYSESLWRISDDFELTRIGDAFVYRRRAGRNDAPLAPSVEQSSRAAQRRRRRSIADESRPDDSRARTDAAGRRRSADTLRASPPVHRARDTDEVSPTAPTRTAGEALAAGETAFRAGDQASAIVAFRQHSYLDPRSPIAHLALALALEASGDARAARRAFAAARAALEDTDADSMETTLGGYRAEELVRLLEQKLAGE